MKPKISIAVLSLLLTITVSNSYASTIEDRRPLKERVSSMTENEKKARLEEIKARVEYIKEIDKSELSRSERKALKKELKDMNKEARVMSGGVYLSVGAIIIIILLLILIL
ncbi:MAG TPA: hypothetical protein VK644_09390 [Chitinophagaceae bacterium]|nr:hypothetical protein [Chitinophagaceae bacterium]